MEGAKIIALLLLSLSAVAFGSSSSSLNEASGKKSIGHEFSNRRDCSTTPMHGDAEAAPYDDLENGTFNEAKCGDNSYFDSPIRQRRRQRIRPNTRQRSALETWIEEEKEMTVGSCGSAHMSLIPSFSVSTWIQISCAFIFGSVLYYLMNEYGISEDLLNSLETENTYGVVGFVYFLAVAFALYHSL